MCGPLLDLLAVMEGHLASFPSAQHGKAPTAADVFSALRCTCSLLRNSAVLKESCPPSPDYVYDFPAALAHLMPETQRVVGVDWRPLPRQADADALGVSLKVATTHLFQLPATQRGAKTTLAQKIVQ